MEEDEALVAAELADEAERGVHRAGCGTLPEPVGAVDVGQAALAAQLVCDPLPANVRADPPGAAGRVDDEIGLDRRAVHDRAADAATLDDQAVDVPGAQRESGLLLGCLSQRTLEGLPAREHAAHRGVGSQPPRVDRRRAESHPGVVRRRPLLAQELADLLAEVVGVRELHHAAAPPPVGGGPGIAVHGDDVMTATAESSAQDESGRTGADDEDLHDDLRYTDDRIITLRVTPKVEGCQVVEPKRPYRSSLREEQARTTRRAIVEAGTALFVERGFAGTTVDAIAERAGVSRKTVFTSVGGKVGLLKLAIDWALVGDDEPVALDDRPVVRELVRETDPHRAVVMWAHMVTGIAAGSRCSTRCSPRPPTSTSRPRSSTRSPSATGWAVPGASSSSCTSLGALRSDLSVERAAAMASLLMDPLGYRRLVLERRLDRRRVRRLGRPPGRRVVPSSVAPALGWSGRAPVVPASTVRANVTNVSPIRSSCATKANATVAPLTDERNSMLRPLASTMVEERAACSV